MATPLLPATGGNAAWGGEELILALPNEAAEPAGGRVGGRTSTYGSRDDGGPHATSGGAGAPSEAVALKVALWRRPPGERGAWAQEVWAAPLH